MSLKKLVNLVSSDEEDYACLYADTNTNDYRGIGEIFRERLEGSKYMKDQLCSSV